jgi:hypothetical protein
MQSLLSNTETFTLNQSQYIHDCQSDRIHMASCVNWWWYLVVLGYPYTEVVHGWQWTTPYLACPDRRMFQLSVYWIYIYGAHHTRKLCADLCQNRRHLRVNNNNMIVYRVTTICPSNHSIQLLIILWYSYRYFICFWLFCCTIRMSYLLPLFLTTACPSMLL